MKVIIAYGLCMVLWVASSSAQHLGDTSFVPLIDKPAFDIGEGPVVKIDEAHNNFHTKNGRYFAFAEVLRREGYRVESSASEFNLDSLRACRVLVISNALNEETTEFRSVSPPSAFTDEEIEIVRSWVEDGGALFLIADHMPFAGAAGKLAAAFGFEFSDGFAFNKTRKRPDMFRRSDGSLRGHEITDGRDPSERVDSVATFTGQAFKAHRDHDPIIVFDSNYIAFMPEVAWEFDKLVDTLFIDGWMQAAATEYGKGRVFVSGEAAMFSSQVGSGGARVGLSSAEAAQNLRYLRNIMRWLNGSPE
jgi:hypothetical protein